MQKVKFAVKEYIKKIWRFPFICVMKHRLKNHRFSLISANCIGGVLTHDVGEQFRSPTINLIIPEFIKFAENLKFYLSQAPAIAGTTPEGYPIITCGGGVNIIGVHYRSHDELVEKWNTRRLRVNFNNIFLIATDNFLKTKDDYKRFDALPYPKICFTAKNKNKYPWEVFCPEFVKKTEVGDCLRYTNIWGKRIFEKNFDCVKWLNENENFNN